MAALPRYDIGQSYDWNYEHAPAEPPRVAIPPVPGPWTFCGREVNSPLGIPAGPLLNARWIAYYAALGFDVLTYKTVRSRYRACYDPPNLLPLEDVELRGEGTQVRASPGGRSWAISFGMPSKAPAVWMADVGAARQALSAGQVLVVSVVASPEADWTMDDLARDFAQCAGWAAEAGAHVVEANLSCPNVCTAETDLYLSPEASGRIARRIRDAAPDIPLALKVGLFHQQREAEALVEAVSGYATALSATNSITARVADRFGGARRGVGGAAITARCLEETRMLRAVLDAAGSPLELISVGGVMSAKDVRARLDAGARHVQLATAPMLDPMTGIRIRQEWPC